MTSTVPGDHGTAAKPPVPSSTRTSQHALTFHATDTATAADRPPQSEPTATTRFAKFMRPKSYIDPATNQDTDRRRTFPRTTTDAVLPTPAPVEPEITQPTRLNKFLFPGAPVLKVVHSESDLLRRTGGKSPATPAVAALTPLTPAGSNSSLAVNGDAGQSGSRRWSISGRRGGDKPPTASTSSSVPPPSSSTPAAAVALPKDRFSTTSFRRKHWTIMRNFFSGIFPRIPKTVFSLEFLRAESVFLA